MKTIFHQFYISYKQSNCYLQSETKEKSVLLISRYSTEKIIENNNKRNREWILNVRTNAVVQWILTKQLPSHIIIYLQNEFRYLFPYSVVDKQIVPNSFILAKFQYATIPGLAYDQYDYLFILRQIVDLPLGLVTAHQLVIEKKINKISKKIRNKCTKQIKMHES